MHADPEMLALLALGEAVGTEEDHLHAQTCPECSVALTELHELVTLARTAGAEPPLTPPSPDVWSRIRAELTLDPSLESSSASPHRVPVASSNLTARARLAPVEASWSHASGQAELATDDRGRRVLQVSLRADLPPSGIRQAWLIHRDDPTVRQTLGILDGAHGLWTVDHSIDLELFSILDVSQQGPGETEHSGRTIVRGELVLAG